METMETSGGNTNSPEVLTKGRCVPGKKWCFTSFDSEMETMETILGLNHTKYKYIAGKETCPTTGKVHLQGYVECMTKIRPNETFGTKTTHWEKAKGTTDQNVAYCSKDGDYVTNMDVEEPLEEPFEGMEMYEWQKQVCDIVKGKPDRRKIYWFWEKEGCSGKSTLVKHLCMHYKAISVGGKGGDIKHGVSDYLLKRKSLKALIYDVPRIVGNVVSYSSIEEIKNGCMFSGKYEGGMKIFNTPHVVVFANEPPVLSSLSKDRWVVVQIKQALQ